MLRKQQILSCFNFGIDFFLHFKVTSLNYQDVLEPELIKKYSLSMQQILPCFNFGINFFASQGHLDWAVRTIGRGLKVNTAKHISEKGEGGTHPPLSHYCA